MNLHLVLIASAWLSSAEPAAQPFTVVSYPVPYKSYYPILYRRTIKASRQEAPEGHPDYREMSRCYGEIANSYESGNSNERRKKRTAK